MEGAGESPDAIRAVFGSIQDALDEEIDAPSRVTDEVFERVSGRANGSETWFKGRRVVWFVEPGGANDPIKTLGGGGNG